MFGIKRRRSKDNSNGKKPDLKVDENPKKHESEDTESVDWNKYREPEIRPVEPQAPEPVEPQACPPQDSRHVWSVSTVHQVLYAFNPAASASTSRSSSAVR